MPYNTMTDHAPGEPLPAATMDDLRENIEWLASRGVRGSASDSSDRTSTSASFVDINAAISVTVTTYGNPIKIVLAGLFYPATFANLMYIDFTIDSVRLGGSNGLFGFQHTCPLLVYPVLTLAAGSHTIRPQWRNASGATMTALGATVPTKLFVLDG